MCKCKEALVPARVRHNPVQSGYYSSLSDGQTCHTIVPSASTFSAFHSLKNLGTCCLATAGLLDILACVLPDIIKSSIINADGDGMSASGKAMVQVDHAPKIHSNVAYPVWFLDFIRWLDENSNSVFLIFSLLWLVGAFFSKHTRCQKALMEEERRRLAWTDDNAVEKKKWRQTPKVPYCISIKFQIFFTVIEEFLTITILSVMGAIAHHFYRSAVQITDTQVELANSKAIKTILGRAIKNPVKFRKDLKDFLTLLRWVKYMSPLISAGIKISLNTLDMLKRRKVGLHTRRAKKVKQLICEKWEKSTMTKDSAAAVIQTAFRANLARKRRRALLLLKNDKEHRMVLKLQRKFRRHLKEARERIVYRRWELGRLRMIWREDADMSDDEKRTMHRLQEELGREDRELRNRKLLLRPNTKFAVAWKAFLIAAVLWEMTQAAVSPLLRERSETGDLPATTEDFAVTAFMPTSVADLAACREETQNGASESGDEDRPWYFQDPIARWQGGFGEAVPLALIPAPVAEWPECLEKEQRWIDRLLRWINRMLRWNPEGPKHWYCLGSRPAWHAACRKLVDLVLSQFRYFLGVVMFLDVFVAFFTGRFDRTTGELVPQHWFMRWIIPGLLLQLVVNPYVAGVSDAVSRCLGMAAAMGPYRVYRHVMAVGVPLACGVTHALVEWLWLPMVSYENRAGVIESPFLKSIM